MAASTSSLAARRAGQLAASRPSSAARTRKITRFETGTTVFVMPCECSADTERDAQPRPHDDADDGAEDGEDHRLRTDHGADLAPLHAHACSRPISWVRSNTESMSVLTMPMSAMTTARASSA